MSGNNTTAPQRIYFTLAITLFAVLHLAIEMLSGGVREHYPLMNEDLPALSNWWALVVLPVLGWLTHTTASPASHENSGAAILGLDPVVIFRLAAGFVYGATLAAGFELGLGQMPLYLLLGLFAGGVFYPLYRLEIMLGLVMGMTYTFGAVIPTVVASLVALISLFTHNAALFILRKLKSQAH